MSACGDTGGGGFLSCLRGDLLGSAECGRQDRPAWIGGLSQGTGEGVCWPVGVSRDPRTASPQGWAKGAASLPVGHGDGAFPTTVSIVVTDLILSEKHT